jgi:sulfide:quinone oxidoreductase
VSSQNSLHKIVIVGGGSAGISVPARLLNAGVFTMPSGPIKCAGAPQKIAYLAADWWRKQGVLSDIHVVLVLPAPKMFGVPEFSAVLEQVAARYGIDVRLKHEVVEVNPAAKEMVLVNRQGGGEEKSVLPYDIAHLVPPQSAPAWIKGGPLADPANPGGTCRSTRRRCATPATATCSASAMPAPRRTTRPARRSGSRRRSWSVTSGPSWPAVSRVRLTTGTHHTIPLIDTKKERYDMWLLKRYGLPFMYWKLMLKGRV